MGSDLQLLFSLETDMQQSAVEMPELLKKIDEFTFKRPSSFVRLVFESACFRKQPSEFLGVSFSKWV